MSELLSTIHHGFNAIVVVSPMIQGGTCKDQDRARWYGPGRVACVCDGVTSSPHSQKAAEIATTLAPILFNDNPKDNLKRLSDLLMALRQECETDTEINLPAGVPESMRQILGKAMLSKRAISYQTTLVAVQLIQENQTALTRVLKCGDSGLFAFLPQGELLMSSLDLALPSHRSSEAEPRYQSLASQRKTITFGPGKDILVRLEGSLSEYKGLAENAGIDTAHVNNWFVGTPIDSSPRDQKEDQIICDIPSLTLQSDDRLLLPKYLYGHQLTSDHKQYRVLQYSSAIRPVYGNKCHQVQTDLASEGAATLVLPDHYYCGAFECYQDTFPLQTQYLLCSDGLYNAFVRWSDLYQWLTDHSIALQNADTRQEPLQQLHDRLQSTKGDDDISFVWIRPNMNQAERQVHDVC
ncbi:protein phosphatase 2C domain-containing protein [Planctomycetota bacterium]